MPGCGSHLEIGTLGATIQPDGTVCWRVWAPKLKALSLVLFDAAGTPDERPMEREPGGTFLYQASGMADGQRYAFRLESGALLPDPASSWQPDGVHRPSAVLDTQRFVWNDAAWTGVSRDKLVIYEVHVGTFTPEGTFEAIIPRLETLRELGVTAIEIMPVAQFPGERNWGYDGVHPYAAQNSYGGPHGLARLVDACHRAGLAVILDVVYNHFGPEGNYLAEFAPYFTASYKTPWGQAINFDGPDSDGVRAFVLNNVRHWVRDFHVDGLRLDAVQAIFDSSPCHILREIKDVAAAEADARGWPVHVIAESDQNDVRLIDSPDNDGYGLDGVWSDDFHHSVHTLLTGEQQGHYMDYGSLDHLLKALNRTFVYDGIFSQHRKNSYGTPAHERPGDRFVISIQNHDQVGNRAEGDRFGTLLNPAQQRLAAGLLLLAPHIPLLFMGEEYSETRPFPFFCSFGDPDLVEAVRRGRREEFAPFAWQGEVPDPQDESTFRSAKLSWSWPQGSPRARLRDLYRKLLDARQRWPALRDFNKRAASMLCVGEPHGVLRLVRGGNKPEDEGALVVYFNLDDRHHRLPEIGAADSCLLLSSESERYGGSRPAGSEVDVLLPYEFQVHGPADWKTA